MQLINKLIKCYQWLAIVVFCTTNAHDTLLLQQINCTFGIYCTVPVEQLYWCFPLSIDEEKSELSKCKPLLLSLQQ